jgi:voltage-gated potassium channel
MDHSRWRKVTEWPLAIVAIAFLASYSWEVIGDLNGAKAVVAETLINVTWGVFVVDYIVTLVLARPRWRWFHTHLLDLAVVVLPVLRPLRLLRLVTVLNVLHRTTGAALRGRVIMYAATASTLLVYVAALAVLDAERGKGTINNFGDGLWWAFVTITTVGYGDVTPVTAIGRLIAVGVMIGGIALIGVVTATLASWIVQRVADDESVQDAVTQSEIAELKNEVESLRGLIERAPWLREE